MGFVSDRDILTAVSAIEAALQELNYENLNAGAGVAAAAQVLAQG